MSVSHRRICVNTTQAAFPEGSSDITYDVCPSFRAFSGDGKVGLAGISAGEFVVLSVDNSVPCVNSVTIVPPFTPPTCDSVGFDGQITATWEGFSNVGQSVLYERTGGESRSPIVALQWCNPPTVSGISGQALSMSEIKIGASVQITFAGGPQGPWLGSVVVEP